MIDLTTFKPDSAAGLRSFAGFSARACSARCGSMHRTFLWRSSLRGLAAGRWDVALGGLANDIGEWRELLVQQRQPGRHCRCWALAASQRERTRWRKALGLVADHRPGDNVSSADRALHIVIRSDRALLTNAADEGGGLERLRDHCEVHAALRPAVSTQARGRRTPCWRRGATRPTWRWRP